MYYTIFDHANKSLVYDETSGTEKNSYRDMVILEFKTEEEANEWKTEDLKSGNYYNRPESVYEIIANDRG